MKIFCIFSALCLAVQPARAQDPQITNVVETGGDNEAVDTITAKWTGQTFNISIENEPVPGAAVGNPYTVGPFSNLSPAFVDRNHRFINASSISVVPGTDIPAYLDGKPYIMSGNDNRDNGSYILNVTVDRPARVYMLIDNRLSDLNGGDPPTFGPTAMQWILDEGWQGMMTGSNRTADALMPDEIAFDEVANDTIDQWSSVYYRDVLAGTFTLKQADNATRNMYSVVVGPLPPPTDPIQVFTGNPAEIAFGGQSTLNWLIAGSATSATIDNGPGNVLPRTTAGTGSVQVSPTATTTYKLTVNTPGGNETATVTVKVKVLATFTATPPNAAVGGSTTLVWTVYPGATVTLSGVGDVTSLTNAAGAGSVQVSPAAPTLYTLTAERGGVTETASLGVSIVPPATRYALLDIGSTDGIVEPGATSGAVLGAGGTGLNGTDFPATALTSESADQFTLAIDALDPDGNAVGGLDWRDRGDAPNVVMAHLGEHLVKNNQGMIRVTLGSLPAGEYGVVSYHLDPTFSQSEQISILVRDAANGGGLRSAGVTADASYPGHPDNTNAVAVPALNAFTVGSKGTLFGIVSDGVNDVVIYFDSRAALVDSEVPLSGLLLLTPKPYVGVSIVSLQHTRGAVTDSVALEFSSQPGREYRVQHSEDLQTWSTLADHLPARAAAASTVYEATGIPRGTGKVFYRVMRL